jgi:hypothetical protein
MSEDLISCSEEYEEVANKGATERANAANIKGSSCFEGADARRSQEGRSNPHRAGVRMLGAEQLRIPRYR